MGELISGSIVDKIIHKSGDIDVYIVNQNTEYEKQVQKIREPLRMPKATAVGIAESFLLAAFIGKLLKISILETALILLFFAVVIISDDTSQTCNIGVHCSCKHSDV